ncbi:MAG TPA: TIM44-like domain-containing protein [Pyrinomonadaceae bacterium]|nr:TIM44-like domain-containing protein [Pyrinomonadaceae bacterium]
MKLLDLPFIPILPNAEVIHRLARQTIRGTHQVRKHLFAVSLLLVSGIEVFARVGGGQGYGGGGGGGGGDSDGGFVIWIVYELIRLLIYLTIEYPLIGIPLDIIVIAAVIYYFTRRARRATTSFSSAAPTLGLNDQSSQRGAVTSFEQLRRFDPNFSEIVFSDFAYTLYAKAHHARGQGPAAINQLSPYLSEGTRRTLLNINASGLKEVKGIIIGAMTIGSIRGLETPVVRISLEFEANYTEVTQSGGKTGEMTYYVRERWDLERKRDLLSPPPAKDTALHCPRCGAALQTDTTGACAFCGVKIESGEFQWYVQNVALLHREAKGPLLTSNVPEVGTNFPSVVQPGFDKIRIAFEQSNPNFSWGKFQARARLIFDELQGAWSTFDWERARPHETDNLFQMHQYWIDAYRRQQLRNVLDQCTVTAMQPVKIKEDAFYNSITLRIGANGFDYTVDTKGNVVAGSKTQRRSWSEYWTFIRNRQAPPVAARAELNCPNCGAPLKVNMAGVCQFCGGKITSGEFDWVLSKIEQDESYRG